MKNLLIISLLVLVSSCRLFKPCPNFTTTEQSTITEVVRDTVIEGTTLRDTVFLIDFKTETKTQTKWKTKVITDTSGLAELRVYKDKYGNLIIDCEAKDKVIEGYKKQVAVLNRTESQPTWLEHTITEVKHLLNKFKWWLILLLIACVIYYLVRNKSPTIFK